MPIVALVVLVLLRAGLREFPRRLMDGRAVADRLELALAGSEPPTFTDGGYPPAKFLILPSDLSLEEFTERARTVDGWQHLAIIPPYGDGEALAEDERIRWTPSALSLTWSHGWPQDSLYDVLIIRRGFVIGGFSMQSEGLYLGDCILSRE